MPTYAFRCRDCGHQFDMTTSWTKKREARCPECGSASLAELFGQYRLTSLNRNGSGSGAPRGGFT